MGSGDACMLHGLCFGEEAGARVRSSMRFLNLCLQIALAWLHGCCHLVLPCA